MKSDAYANEFEFEGEYKIDINFDDSKEIKAILTSSFGVTSEDFYNIPIQSIRLKWNAEIYAGNYGFEGMKITVPDQTILVEIQIDKGEKEGANGRIYSDESTERKDFILKNVEVEFVSGEKNKLSVEPDEILWSANKSYVKFK